MLIRNIGQAIVLVIAVAVFCSGANADKTVYKWVDEDGQVHFGDAPPDNSSSTETETLVIPKSPAQASPTQPVVTPRVAAATGDKSQTEKPAEEAPTLYEKTDVSSLSLADLDLRCDDAREKMIAPLREAEIVTCKADGKNDPAWCDRFNADYGEGGRNINGSMRPRMFDDLPECVEATKERNRRGR